MEPIPSSSIAPKRKNSREHDESPSGKKPRIEGLFAATTSVRLPELPEKALVKIFSFLSSRKIYAIVPKEHPLAMKSCCDAILEYEKALHRDPKLRTIQNDPQFSTEKTRAIFKSFFEPLLQKYNFSHHCILLAKLSSNYFYAILHWLNTQSPEQSILYRATLKGHSRDVNCAIPFLGGVLSGSDDDSIKFWDISKDQEPTCSLTLSKATGHNGHSDCVSTLCALEHNKTFVSSSYDASLKLWDMSSSSNKCLRTMTMLSEDSQRPYRGIFSNLTLLPGDRVASSTDDGRIIIWNVSKYGRNTPINILEGHESIVNSLLTPRLRPHYLISCSDDGTHKIWNPSLPRTDDQCLETFGPDNPIRIDHMTELPGFNILISAYNNESYDDTSTHSSNNDTASSHASDPEEPAAEIDSEPHTPSHSPEMEAAQIPADTVALKPAENGHSWMYELPSNSKKVSAILGLPQRLIAIGMDDGMIEIWDPDIKNHKTACIKRLVGHSNTIMSLSVTPRCELLSASSDHTVIIWNMAAVPDYPTSPANELINLWKKRHKPE